MEENGNNEAINNTGTFKRVSCENHGIPVGMIKDIRSAISPQSARFVWNIAIHVINRDDHMTAPMIDRTTYILICFCSS